MPGKLGKTSKQRIALLRGQASQLLWYGKIETTASRAKELQSYVEKLITKAVNTYDDVIEYDVIIKDKKGKDVRRRATSRSARARCSIPSSRSCSTKSHPSMLSGRRSLVKAADTREFIFSANVAATQPNPRSSNWCNEFNCNAARGILPRALFLDAVFLGNII